MANEKKKTGEKAVVVRDNSAVEEVSSFIEKAIEAKLPVEQMQKLLDMHKEVKAMHAKEAFVAAMSAFQGECPVITKNKVIMNKDGRSIRSRYADLGNIVSQVKALLAKNGLSYTFESIFEANSITVVCHAIHELGHSEKSQFKLPIGEETYMSEAQKYGARVTFGRRYAFCDVFGILTGDEDSDDTDGERETPAAPKFTKEQVDELVKKIEVAKDIKELSEIFMSAGEAKLAKPVFDAKEKRKAELIAAESKPEAPKA